MTRFRRVRDGLRPWLGRGAAEENAEQQFEILGFVSGMGLSHSKPERTEVAETLVGFALRRSVKVRGFGAPIIEGSLRVEGVAGTRRRGAAEVTRLRLVEGVKVGLLGRRL